MEFKPRKTINEVTRRVLDGKKVMVITLDALVESKSGWTKVLRRVNWKWNTQFLESGTLENGKQFFVKQGLGRDRRNGGLRWWETRSLPEPRGQ